jgi:hypothetical protein
MNGKNNKRLAPFLLVRYQRNHQSLEDHMKAAGIPGAPYKGQTGDFRCYALADDPRFAQANYLEVTGIGAVLGDKREPKAKAAKPARAVAGKPAKVAKQAKEKTVKAKAAKDDRPVRKVKGADGRIVEIGSQAQA